MNDIKIVQTLMAALQSGNLEVAANMLADNCVITGITSKELNKGQMLALQSALLGAMPDFSYQMSNIQQRGEHIEAFIQVRGTHTDELELPQLGLPSLAATGIAIVLPQEQVTYHIIGQQVVRMEIEAQPGSGLSGLLQQIGAELPLAPRQRNSNI